MSDKPRSQTTACAFADLHLPGERDCEMCTDRDAAIDRWLGEIQTYLEARIADAPTESCAVLARNLWNETAEFDGDVG